MHRPHASRSLLYNRHSLFLTLATGARLGPYEIVSALGAGGMGEVYRAIDTRLGRAVAVKTSVEQFSSRFDREARAIAAVNHPNICTLYDVGPNYLVMELVEGETLALRLRAGPLPTDLVLEYGRGIARALRAAHEKGIVHRDLKPANIMITKSGIKVLDFGIAKVHGNETMTVTNAILGTPAYMAPEQLSGEEADARTDIYALGLVLYEMATGSHLPAGSESLASLTPPLDHTIRNCLARDRDKRWQSAADIEIALGWKPAPVGVAPRSRTWLPWSMAGAALALMAFVLLVPYFRGRSVEARAVQLQMNPPQGREFRATDTAFSPDGKHLAFVTGGPVSKLWVRELDALAAKELQGTDGALLPFWSPDERSLGFFAGGKLKRIDLSTERVVTLADAPAGRGGSWNADNVIVFCAATNGPIWKISAAGDAKPSPATMLDSPREASHRFPAFLPDGHHFLYYVRAADPAVRGIYWASLDNPQEKHRVVESMYTGTYVPPDDARSGLLLRMTEEGGLLAQSFDAFSGQISGEPALVPDMGLLRMGYDRQTPVSASRDGTLVYGANHPRYQLTWYDRQGRPTGTVGGADAYAPDSLRISPDDKHVAVSLASDKMYSWVIDLSTEEKVRVTGEGGGGGGLAWSPNGGQLAFLTGGLFTGMRATVYVIDVSGTSPMARLTNTPHSQGHPDWSPDGQFILFQQTSSEGKFDLWYVSVTGERRATPFRETSYQEFDGRFSPDGKWVAYTSDQTGRQEIWVETFPPATQKLQVSTDGGTDPVWRKDGQELFYRSLNGNLMTVPVRNESGPIRFATPTVLFAIDATAYDVSKDGTRFLTLANVRSSEVSPLTFFLNWRQKVDARH